MDGIAEWTRAYERVADLVEGLPPDRTAATVPACPEWTVRDLLSHMVGLCADVVAGDEPDDHNSAWTQAQVDARKGRDVATLLVEWRDVAGPLQEWMREHSTRPLGDVVIHEQDLRGALEVPGARDTAGLHAIRDSFVGRFADRLGELPPVALVGSGWRWTSTGTEDDAAVVVTAPDFDLARALLSRRSANQLRGWTTRGDVEPYLPAFAGIGSLPATDLVE